MREFRSVTRPLVVETRKIADLTPYERNARTHSDAQISQIVRSIEQFGFAVPLIVDENDMVLAGHGRIEAAERLHMTELPVIALTDLTQEQKRAFILADNRIAMNAGWDDELIRGELEALKDAGFGLDVLGFDDSELKRLLDDIDVAAPTAFERVDEDIPVEHECPACHYRWSGSSKPRE